MLKRVSHLLAACAVMGATVLPAMAQTDGTMMQGDTTMQGGAMMSTGPLTTTGPLMTTGDAMGGMGTPTDVTGDMMMVGGMMDPTMNSYISADAAGRARILGPMTLRQQVDFLTRFYKMPVTGQQMVSLGMVRAGMADPNNMAATTMTGSAMGGPMMEGGNMSGGAMQGGAMSGSGM